MKAKILKQVFDSLSSNPTKKIIQIQETDDDFLDDIFAIAEHSQTIRKEMCGPRPKLTEAQYQFVQKTGKIHYRCCKFNQTNLMSPVDIQDKYKCECGCGKAYGQQLPYCINEEDTTFIGPGVILFFFYTKAMFLLVLMSIIVYGIYSLTTNLLVQNYHSDCSKPGALSFMCQFKIITSIESKDGRDDLLIGQLALGVVMCFIWSLAIRVIRALGRRKNKMIDQYLDSSADLCIMIENLPEGDYSEKEILKFMRQKWEKKKELNQFPLQIKGVQIVYTMKRVRKMIDKIHTISKQIVSIVEVKEKVENQIPYKIYHIKESELLTYKHKKEQILLMYSKLKSFRDKFWDDAEFRHWLSAGVAIVEFEHPGQQEQFLQQYGTNKKTIIKEMFNAIKQKYFKKITEQFQGEIIKIIKAPEPSDIFWEHCEQKIKKRRIFVVWVINICLMGLSFGAQMIVREIKIAYPEIHQLGIVSIFTLNFFNRIVWNMLLTVIFIERNYTKTDNITSAMNKSYVSQVMNIILIPIILNLVLANNLDGANGLAGAIHDYQITAFFFMMIFNFINFPDLIMRFIRNIKCLRRLAIKFYCHVTGELDTFEQMRDVLNFLYTPPIVPVAGFYVYITTVISQAAFFCHLQPMILCYLLASIALFHLINRYLVLKRCKTPDLIDFVVFETCCGFAMNVPLLYAFGTIMFLNLRNAPGFEFYVPSIFCIIIWLLSTQSPFGLYQKMTSCVLQKIFPENKPELQDHQAGLNFIGRIMKLALKEKKKPRQVIKRQQNYHANCTTTLIFNMQNQLQEVAGRYHNRSKQFCHRFSLNMGKNDPSIDLDLSDNQLDKTNSQNQSSSKRLLNEEQEIKSKGQSSQKIQGQSKQNLFEKHGAIFNGLFGQIKKSQQNPVSASFINPTLQSKEKKKSNG